jgi:hypothetical protein
VPFAASDAPAEVQYTWPPATASETGWAWLLASVTGFASAPDGVCPTDDHGPQAGIPSVLSGH